MQEDYRLVSVVSYRLAFALPRRKRQELLGAVDGVLPELLLDADDVAAHNGLDELSVERISAGGVGACGLVLREHDGDQGLGDRPQTEQHPVL
jgi:hypothetical protein